MADNFYSTYGITPDQIAEMYGGIYAPTPSTNAFSNGLNSQQAVNAFYEGIINPGVQMQASGIGQPSATRTVQSVPMGSSRINEVGTMPGYSAVADMFAPARQPSGVTRLANGIAGTVQLPRDVRPNVPSLPSTANRLTPNAHPAMPTANNRANPYGIPNMSPLLADAFGGVLPPVNPAATRVAQQTQQRPTTVISGQQAPIPAAPSGAVLARAFGSLPQSPQMNTVAQTAAANARNRQQNTQMAVTTPRQAVPAGGITQPRRASLALAYSGPQGNSPIAQMFEAAGTRRLGTNGYVYAANGAGGYDQIGTSRPVGMTPAQQYESAGAGQSYHPHTSHSFFSGREGSDPYGGGGHRYHS